MAEDIGAESGILFSYGKSIFDLLQGDIIVRCCLLYTSDAADE